MRVTYRNYKDGVGPGWKHNMVLARFFFFSKDSDSTGLFLLLWTLFHNGIDCYFIVYFKMHFQYFWQFLLNLQVFVWNSHQEKKSSFKKSWKSQNLKLLKKVSFFCLFSTKKSMIPIFGIILEDKEKNLNYQVNKGNKAKFNFLSPKSK